MALSYYKSVKSLQFYSCFNLHTKHGVFGRQKLEPRQCWCRGVLAKFNMSISYPMASEVDAKLPFSYPKTSVTDANLIIALVFID
jgi:hypothetical protein